MRFTVLCLLLVTSNVMAADYKACLLEGEMTVLRKKILIKDCVESRGLSFSQLKQNCEGMSQAAAQMGGKPAKISYLAACPKGQQAICDSTKAAKSAFYYYLRQTEDLPGVESGCKALKGTWIK